MSGGTTIGEFAINLFVDAGKGELTIGNLVKSMGELEVASVGEIAVLATLANKLLSITMHTIAGSEALLNYTSITGASAETLQRWASAATHVGLKGQEVANVFQSMSHAIELGHITGNYGALTNAVNFLPGFGQALLKARADHPEDLLGFLRNSKEFQEMVSPKKEVLLSEMGIGVMQRALTQGAGGISNKKFKIFSEESGVLSQGDIDKYHEMSDALTSFENTATRIGHIISKWFSDDTLAFLRLEADSLKVIADWMETVSVKGYAKRHAGDLDSIKSFMTAPDLYENFLKPLLWGKYIDKKGYYENGELAPLPTNFNPIPLRNSPVYEDHTTHASIKVDIHGTHLNETQLAAAIHAGVKNAFQPSVNLLNTGTVA